MDNSDIIYLVKQCVNGKQESFGAVVTFFQKRIYDLCFYYLRTPQDAEDASAEIFIKAYSALDTFNPQYAFSTWLYRIAINHSIGVLRRRKRETRYLEHEGADPLALTHGHTPEGVFFAESQRESFEEALDLLPIKYRTPLLLKYQQDLSYQEISQILDIPVNTVGSLVLRGKKELRELIKAHGQEVLP